MISPVARSARDLQPVLRLDAEVSMPEISWLAWEELDRLKPMGQGNPRFSLWCAR